MRVVDGIYIDVVVGPGKGFSEKGVVSLIVSGMGRIEVFDWSQDLDIVRVCLAQSMVGFVTQSQESLRMTFSWPQPMT